MSNVNKERELKQIEKRIMILEALKNSYNENKQSSEQLIAVLKEKRRKILAGEDDRKVSILKGGGNGMDKLQAIRFRIGQLNKAIVEAEMTIEELRTKAEGTSISYEPRVRGGDQLGMSDTVAEIADLEANIEQMKKTKRMLENLIKKS